MTIKSSLKNLFFLFFILAGKLICNPKIKERTIEINKVKTLKSHQSKNQDIKKSQLFSQNIEQTPNFIKKIGNPLSQSKQALNHIKTRKSDQLDSGVVADIETIQKFSSREETKTIKQCDEYFVLLHGLAESKDTFSYFEENLKKALEERGWGNIKLIYPKSREGLSSVRSLHVNDVFKEIKNKVGDAKVHLIGYSQGGLVVGELEEKKYKNLLNIGSTIYISTPFFGIGAMDTTEEDINEFLNNASQPLRELANSQNLDIEKINKWIKKERFLLYFVSYVKKFTSLGRLYPDSNENLVGAVRSGSQIVPRLIIGAYASFVDLFHISVGSAKKLDWYYAKLLKKSILKNVSIDNVLKNSMKNDNMIPLSSQLARRSSIDQINLDGIGDNGSEIPGPDGCINTEYYVFPKTAHAWTLPIIDYNLLIEFEDKKCYPVLASPQVASRVADFLSKHIGAAS